MGTRHLITIFKDGEYKLAQYGQWDGMPAHQGSEILKFLGNGDLEALKRGIDKLFYVSDEELEALYQTAGIPAGQDWMDMNQEQKVKELFPTIHRDTGAKIFDLLASGATGSIHDLEGREEQIPTIDYIAFVGGFGCEWAYTVDLDAGTFETYECGFTEEAAPTRFSAIINKEYEDDEDGPRFAKLVGSFEIANLPSRQEYMETVDPEGLQRETAWLARLAVDDAVSAADGEDAAAAENKDDGDKPAWAM